MPQSPHAVDCDKRTLSRGDVLNVKSVHRLYNPMCKSGRMNTLLRRVECRQSLSRVPYQNVGTMCSESHTQSDFTLYWGLPPVRWQKWHQDEAVG